MDGMDGMDGMDARLEGGTQPEHRSSRVWLKWRKCNTLAFSNLQNALRVLRVSA
jgi:hypothetical protein